MHLRSLACVAVLASVAPLAAAYDWPEVEPESKPWTRWWWPGSAVTKADLTADLEAIARVGIGGVELTPVYGAKGYEDRYLSYLSPGWLEAFDHVLRETERLGLGLDMANGTGWNFGGPTVGEDDAPKHVVYRRFSLRGGERLTEPVAARQKPFVQYVLNQVYGVSPAASRAADAGAPAGHTGETIASVPAPDISELRDPLSANPNLQQLAIDQIKFARDLPLQTLMAYGADGQTLDLTSRVGTDGALDWTAPAGDWSLFAIFQAWNGKLVERAGPGGEGYMIDHFSPGAITRYLSQFDRVFAPRDLGALRGFFNDSYEVDDARQASDWTDDYLAEFQRRRGYDLRQHLPALFATDGHEQHQRVLMDYRETLSDLLLDRFTRSWADWANQQGKLIRNQAHGSPANILDLYAASDIPETEGISPANIRFASSAAHVSGKPLVGAEAVTFLNENFHSTPAQIRENLRRYWLNGVNHAVYHGTAFAPQDEAWPGWFFYVAVHLNPRNPIWSHTSAVHHYASRVQSFLQAGRPDNDILLYFPVHDRYAELDGRPLRQFEGDGPTRRLVEHFTTGWPSLQGTPFGELAADLLTRGFAIDYISDTQLQKVEAEGPKLRSARAEYQIVLVPTVRYLPLSTFQRLLALAGAGATIAFVGELPADVAGWHQHEENRAQLARLKSELTFRATESSGIRQAVHGRGRILLGPDATALLAIANVRREPLHDRGLQTIRRRLDDSTVYYIVNPTDDAVDGWVRLSRTGPSAAIYDAATGQTGRAQLRPAGDAASEVYLQVEPHGSRLVRVYSNIQDGPPYPLWRAATAAQPLDAGWQVTFREGGPTLPAPQTVDQLRSWAEFPGDGYDAFSGTAAYTTTFARPAGAAAGWWLDLGRVEETAQVLLNGTDLGIVVGPVYRVFLPADAMLPRNTLEVRVANLGANRIAELDRRDPSWKKLYNQNIRPLRAANRGPDGMFRAAHWDPIESGLLGPVTLIPLQPLPVTP